MTQTTKRRLFGVFHILVSIYATVLFVGSLTQIAYGQSIRDYRVENLESRMAGFDALKLDQRLTRIETILNDIHKESTGGWISEAANGGIGLLLLRAVFLEVRKKRGIE